MQGVTQRASLSADEGSLRVVAGGRHRGGGQYRLPKNTCIQEARKKCQNKKRYLHTSYCAM